jgi:DNA-binding response OmpR family regulator
LDSKGTGVTERVATALLVSPHKSDHYYFDSLFGRTNWKLHHAYSNAEAEAFLREQSVPVVIIDEDLDPGAWDLVVEASGKTGLTPKLLVASLLTAGGGWAEALNSGAYDVLARPLDQQEVLHSISMAWLAWKCERFAFRQ